MSRNSLFVMALISILLILASIVMCPHASNSDNSAKNPYVVAIDSFNVLDSHTGTYTIGSTIVQKTGGALYLKIIGSLHIAEGDFGGVCFYFENGFHFESIFISYRDEINASSVAISDIPFDKPYPGGTTLSIGRTPEIGGGDGFFEITYLYVGSESIESVSSINMSVATGSYFDGDHKVVGATVESFIIKL